MDGFNNFPGYQFYSGFDNSNTFDPSKVYNNNQNNSISTIDESLDHIDRYTTTHEDMSHCPITPTSRRTNGRGGAYPGLPDNMVTPYAQQYGRSASYTYANHGMSLQQTPVPPMMYGSGPAPIMHAPAPAVPSHGFVTYNGSSQSFSDSSDNTDVVHTPTPKQHGTLTPASSQSPQSPQSNGEDLPTVPLSQLQYDDFDEAEAEASGRTPLHVQNDDWEFVEADKRVHVAAIMAAFDAPFRDEPKVPLTVAEKTRWVKYQTEQTDKVANYVARNPKAKELSAWLLLEALLNVHKLGYKKGLRVNDPDTCCSARFADVSHPFLIAQSIPLIFSRMVLAIRNYSVIRFDLVRMQRIDDLATSPSHGVSRKVANWRGNAGKVKRDEANKRIAATHGVEYKNVLGDKRKYKPIHPAQAVDNEEGNEDVSGTDTPLGKLQGFKRKAVNDGDEEEDFNPLATPSKSARKTAPASTNKRVKLGVVIAGPDTGI